MMKLQMSEDQISKLSPKAKAKYKTKQMLNEILESKYEVRKTKSPWDVLKSQSQVPYYMRTK
jgi:hypothetical protein